MPARDGRLVCEYLENVAGDLLRDYPDIVSSLAQNGNGIYALYRGDRLYYLGLATNLRRRLDQHLRDRHRGTWDRFSLYLTVDDRHLREIEALFLRISKPRGNRTAPRLTGSENLGTELRRQIRDSQRQQRNHILGQKTAGDRGGEAPPLRRTTPALAGYGKKPMRIRLLHGGRTHIARVDSEGTIHYQGSAFASPSGAACAITGVPTNGWQVWQYRRGPGEWVPLRELRR